MITLTDEKNRPSTNSEQNRLLVSHRNNSGNKQHAQVPGNSSGSESSLSIDSNSDVSIMESDHKTPKNNNIDSNGANRAKRAFTLQRTITASLVKAKRKSEEAEANVQMPCLMINPFSCTRIAIDLLVIVTLSYVILTYPLRLGFDDVWRDESFVIADYLIDFVYILDFLASFITAYKNDDKAIIVSYKLIALNYLSRMFILDLFSAIPFRFFIPKFNEWKLLLKLLKWPKIFKIFSVYRTVKVKLRIRKSKFISKIISATSTRSPGLRRFLWALLLTTIISHFVACFWSYIADTEDSYRTWKTENGVIDEGYKEQYILSFYWTVQTLLTVGYGDVGQYTAREKFFAISWMLVSVFVYSFFVSSISAMISYNDHVREVTREYLDTLTFIKKKYKISKELYNKGKYAVTRGLITIDDNSSFFESLPQVLRNDLLYRINKDKVSRIKSFRHFGKEFYGTIGPKLHIINVDSGEILFKKGDFPDVAYFVRRGLVAVCSGPEDKIVLHIPAGYGFGAFALMADSQQRNHKIIALMDTQLLVIKKPDLKEVFEDFKSEETTFKKRLIKINSIIKFYTKHYAHIKEERSKNPSVYPRNLRTIDKNEKVIKMIKTFHKKSKIKKKGQKVFKERVFNFLQVALEDNALKMRTETEDKLLTIEDEEEVHLGEFKDDITVNKALMWKPNVDLDDFFGNELPNGREIDRSSGTFVNFGEIRDEDSFKKSQLDVLNCKTFQDLDLDPEKLDISIRLGQNKLKDMNGARSFAGVDLPSGHTSQSHKTTHVDKNIIKSLKLDMSINLDMDGFNKQKKLVDVKRKLTKLETNISFLKMKLKLLVKPKQKKALNPRHRRRRMTLAVVNESLIEEKEQSDEFADPMDVLSGLDRPRSSHQNSKKNRNKRRFSLANFKHGIGGGSFGAFLSSQDPSAPVQFNLPEKLQSSSESIFSGSKPSIALDDPSPRRIGRKAKSVLKVSLMIPPKKSESKPEFNSNIVKDSKEQTGGTNNKSREKNGNKIQSLREIEDEDLRENGIMKGNDSDALESLEEESRSSSNDTNGEEEDDSFEDILSKIDEGIVLQNEKMSQQEE